MTESASENSAKKNCTYCVVDIPLTAKYCPICGQAQKEEKKFEDVKNDLAALFIFFFLQVAVVMLVEFTPYQPTSHVFYTLLIYSIDFIFAIIYFKSVLRLFTIRKQIIKISLLIIPAAVAVSILVNYLVDQLNYALYHKYYEIVFSFSNLPYPTVFELIEIALLPALFEEIAFRGIIYNMCLKFYHQNHTSAILISSALFFIIHLSFVSFFWMLPFAFLLGYLRKKYNNLIPGIVLHFFFNATAYAIQVWW